MINPHMVHDLPPFDEQHNLRVVVETPRGANIKLKYDEKYGCFSLTRILPLGVVYPYDFGFVPQTLAQDGDPIDVLVLIDVATYPGVVIPCRLLGALQIEERGMRGRPNHRLVAVPIKAARKDDLKDFNGLSERVQRELERFFVMATAFTAKDPQIRGWVGPDVAEQMVQHSIQRYRERYSRPSRPSAGRSEARVDPGRSDGKAEPARPDGQPEAGRSEAGKPDGKPEPARADGKAEPAKAEAAPPDASKPE